MPTYNPAWHPLLSAAAANLGSVELDAHADTAEAILGTGLASLTGDQATLAVVHQVNFQVERGAKGFSVKSWSRGGRSESYGDGQGSRIAPLAAAIMARVPWTTAGSLR